MASKKTEKRAETIVIPPLKEEVLALTIRGTSLYCQNRFSQKAKNMMKAKQELGSQAKKGQQREAKDFQGLWEAALYQSADGWYGIPASGFRNCLISACRLVGFKMTQAKQCLFIEADGPDGTDGTPLVRIRKGKPKYSEDPVRNESGVADIRPRPKWDQGWEAVVKIRYDASLFTAADVANLLHRAGRQVGIGEGRAASPNSNGLCWGEFVVAELEGQKHAA